jgi:hypothetical protein
VATTSRHLGRTSTRHPVRIVHSIGVSAGPARPCCDEDTDPNREHNEYGETFAESRDKVLRGPGLRAALDLSEDDLDRVAERWLPRQKKAGLAAGVTGMEEINYVTVPRRDRRGAARRTPLAPLFPLNFPIMYRLVELKARRRCVDARAELKHALQYQRDQGFEVTPECRRRFEKRHPMGARSELIAGFLHEWNVRTAERPPSAATPHRHRPALVGGLPVREVIDRKILGLHQKLSELTR